MSGLESNRRDRVYACDALRSGGLGIGVRVMLLIVLYVMYIWCIYDA